MQYWVWANYNTYNNVSSVPWSWSDTLWETAISVRERGFLMPRLVMPEVTLLKSHIAVSFASALAADQHLRVRLFDVRGAIIAEFSGLARAGSRAASFRLPRAGVAPGVYMCRVTAGERFADRRLVVSR